MDPDLQGGFDRFDRACVDFCRHVDATEAETRRHVDVVAESLRGELQAVTEGLARIDPVERTLRDEIVRSRDPLAKLIRKLCPGLDRALELPPPDSD